MPLNETEKRLFRHFSNEFDDYMSNAGSNDFFEFVELVPDLEERRKLLLTFIDENYVNDPDCEDAKRERLEVLKDDKCEDAYDFQIWYHLEKKILNE